MQGQLVVMGLPSSYSLLPIGYGIIATGIGTLFIRKRDTS